jgi:hypothetical protein
MIDTPIRKEPEVSPVMTDALNHIKRSIALETYVTELKKAYASKKNLEQLTEITISGDGFKFTLSYNDDSFEEFKHKISDAIISRIQKREVDIADTINGKTDESAKMEA